MSAFQLKVRSGSLTYSENSKEGLNVHEVNALISTYLELSGYNADSLRDLFEHLLTNGISLMKTNPEEKPEVPENTEEVQETPTVETQEIPENAVLVDEDTEKAYAAIFNLIKFTTDKGLEESSSVGDRIQKVIELASVPAPTTETQEAIQKVIGEFDIILNLEGNPTRPAPKKLEILNYINMKRNERFGTTESISDTLNILIFQDSTLLNFNSDAYTGVS